MALTRTSPAKANRLRALQVARVAAAALSVRCTEVVAPEELVGDYQLARVNGEALPVDVGLSNGCTFVVTDGLLAFRRSVPLGGAGDWSIVGFDQSPRLSLYWRRFHSLVRTVFGCVRGQW